MEGEVEAFFLLLAIDTLFMKMDHELNATVHDKHGYRIIFNLF